MMKINKRYLLAFMVITLIEVCIALFIHDKVIRPFVGDILVVILMYTCIRAFVLKSIKLLPIYLFVFSFAIEWLQYIKILKILQLQHNRFLSIVFGTTFDIKDILCYLVGTLILIVWEKIEGRD